MPKIKTPTLSFSKIFGIKSDDEKLADDVKDYVGQLDSVANTFAEVKQQFPNEIDPELESIFSQLNQSAQPLRDVVDFRTRTGNLFPPSEREIEQQRLTELETKRADSETLSRALTDPTVLEVQELPARGAFPELIRKQEEREFVSLSEQLTDERSLAGEAISGIPAGRASFVEMVGRVGRVLNLPGAEKLIKKGTDLGKESAATREGRVPEALRGGVQSTIQSILAGVPGAIAGSPGGALGATLGFALSAGTFFGIAEYDQFLEEVEDGARAGGASAKEAKIIRNQMQDKAIIAGLAEGGFEAISNILQAKVFGLMGGKALSEPAKVGLKNAILEFFGKFAKVSSIELPTELATTAVQTVARESAGVKTEGLGENLKATIGPVLVQSLLVGGIGSAISRKGRPEAEEDPDDADFAAPPDIEDILRQGEAPDLDVAEEKPTPKTVEPQDLEDIVTRRRALNQAIIPKKRRIKAPPEEAGTGLQLPVVPTIGEGDTALTLEDLRQAAGLLPSFEEYQAALTDLGFDVEQAESVVQANGFANLSDFYDKAAQGNLTQAEKDIVAFRKKHGLTSAVKLSDGTVVSDPKAVSHVDLIERKGLDFNDINESGVVTGEGEFLENNEIDEFVQEKSLTKEVKEKPKGETTREARQKKQEALRTSTDHIVDTEDEGEIEVTLLRNKSDGSVTIIRRTGDAGIIEYNSAFAKDKTDEELLKFTFEPSGFKSSKRKKGGEPLAEQRTKAKEAEEAKEIGVEEPGAVEKAAPAIPGQIGLNEDGDPIVEDDRGVRGIIKDGIKVTETVGVIPTKQGFKFERPPHKDKFLTKEELQAKRTEAPEKPTPEPSAVPSDINVVFNKEREGIEVKFPERPAPDVIDTLRKAGFRWSRKKKIWFAKDTAGRRAIVEGLKKRLAKRAEPKPAAEKPKPTVPPGETSYVLPSFVTKPNRKKKLSEDAKEEGEQGETPDRPHAPTDIDAIRDSMLADQAADIDFDTWLNDFVRLVFTEKELNDQATRHGFENARALWNKIKAEAKAKPKPKPADIKPETRTEDSVQIGTDALFEAVTRRLNGDSIRDNRDFNAMADAAFGGTRAQGAWDIKQAYDIMEWAVNDWIRLTALRGTDFIQANFKKFRDILSKLPTQTDRTVELSQLQQFSTPPHLAYLAALALEVKPGETVLEPSAGTGALAVMAELQGGKVHTNEYGEIRANILQRMGYPVTKLNAELIDDLLPANVKPTAIIMNPPFSSSLKTSRKNTAVGFKHLESALKRLAPGGRLVAILGESAGFDRTSQTETWNRIHSRYAIRANINIEGEYSKYGTSFGNVLVVIDKVDEPGRHLFSQIKDNLILTGTFTKVEDAYDAIKTIPQRKAIESREDVGGIADEPGGRAGERGAEQERPGRTELGDTGGRVSESGQPRIRPEQPGADRGDEGTRTDQPAVELQPEGRPEPAQTPKPAVAGDRARPDTGAIPAADIVIEDNLEALENRKEEAGGVFVSYVPAKLKDARPHPANIVESGSMGATTPPKIRYKTKLPQETINPADPNSSDGISGLQLESVLYAGQAHAQTLPNGQRAGFFIGDGTGVGKGREIAAIIYDNFLNGRKKSLWVSFSSGLLEAAKDDFAAVGAGEIPLKLINDFAVNDKIDLKEGTIFTTYSSLIAGGKGGQTRLAQLEKWLGTKPVIIFDEGHKAKNAFETDMKKASKTGTTTVQLQDDIPNARVVYSSATGATDVVNMAYLTRLGLWGEGTAFDSFIDFVQAIDGGGVGAMEMLARDMKAQGKYVARSISFDGVEYTEELGKVTTTAKQRDMWNKSAKAWRSILDNILEAIEETGVSGRAKAFATGSFWNANQRFYQQLLTAFKVPKLIELVEKDLKEGRSAVISLVSTNEQRADAKVAQAIRDGIPLDQLDFSPRDVIAQMVENAFPTTLYEDVENEEGTVISRPVLDGDGNPVKSQEALRKQQGILDGLSDLDLPENPLDQLINHFGADLVAELTGRKKRLIKNKDGTVDYVARNPRGVSAKDVNKWEMGNFQDGKKRIAIISQSASTGISLHASLKSKNQQQRRHYLFELSWSADTEMQRLGRTHRSNQAHPPMYVLMSTDIGGEKRFVSTIAKRLASLGALTKGERKSSGVDLSKYNFETAEGRAAVGLLYRDLAESSFGDIDPIPDVPDGIDAMVDMGIYKRENPGVTEADADNVTRFLNRVLNLDIEVQNGVFAKYMQLFEQVVVQSKQEGKFDDGVVDIKGNNMRLEGKPETIYSNPAANHLAEYELLKADVTMKYTPFEEVEGLADSFYKQKRSGHISHVGTAPDKTDTRTGNVIQRVLVRDHKPGYSFILKSDFDEKYEKVSRADAKKWWNAKIKESPKTKTVEHHIITGTILPIWKDLQSAIAKGSSQPTGEMGQAMDAAGSEQKARLGIVRANTKKGKRIVGVEIPHRAIAQVLRTFAIKRDIKDPTAIYDAILEGGEKVELSQGLSLIRTMFHGSPAIEVAGTSSEQWSRLRNFGLINEKIQWKERFFVPSDDVQGPALIEKLIKEYTPTQPTDVNAQFYALFIPFPIAGIFSGNFDNKTVAKYKAGWEKAMRWLDFLPATNFMASVADRTGTRNAWHEHARQMREIFEKKLNEDLFGKQTERGVTRAILPGSKKGLTAAEIRERRTFLTAITLRMELRPPLAETTAVGFPRRLLPTLGDGRVGKRLTGSTMKEMREFLAQGRANGNISEIAGDRIQEALDLVDTDDPLLNKWHEILKGDIDADGDLMNNSGILQTFYENYINHVWQVDPDGNFKRGGSGPLTTRNVNAKHRTIPSFLAGMAKGFVPKTLNPFELNEIRKKHLGSTLINQAFLDYVSGLEIEGLPALITRKQADKLKVRAEYDNMPNHPFLNYYQFAGSESSTTIEAPNVFSTAGSPLPANTIIINKTEEKRTFLITNQYLVHRTISKAFKALYEPSSFRNNAPGQFFMRVNTFMKLSKLAWSAFHHRALGTNNVFLGGKFLGNPFWFGNNSVHKQGLEQIEKFNPVLFHLIREGLTLNEQGSRQDYHRLSAGLQDAWEKWERQDDPIAKQMLRSIGTFRSWWDHKLWNRYFAGSKAMVGLVQYSKNLKLYQDQFPGEYAKWAAQGFPMLGETIYERSIAKITARDTNDLYGGLPREMLGMSETTMDVLRAVLLAPDWQSSNWRYTLNAVRGAFPGEVREYVIEPSRKKVQVLKGRKLITMQFPIEPVKPDVQRLRAVGFHKVGKGKFVGELTEFRLKRAQDIADKFNEGAEGSTIVVGGKRRPGAAATAGARLSKSAFTQYLRIMLMLSLVQNVLNLIVTADDDDNEDTLTGKGKTVYENPEGFRGMVRVGLKHYIDIGGHFFEPVKLLRTFNPSDDAFDTFFSMVNSVKSYLVSKLAQVPRAAIALITNRDWRGRPFADLDYIKATGENTIPDYVSPRGGGSQLPGWMIQQFYNITPIPAEAVLRSAVKGDIDAAAAAFTVIGFHTKRSYLDPMVAAIMKDIAKVRYRIETGIATPGDRIKYKILLIKLKAADPRRVPKAKIRSAARKAGLRDIDLR